MRIKPDSKFLLFTVFIDHKLSFIEPAVAIQERSMKVCLILMQPNHRENTDNIPFYGCHQQNEGLIHMKINSHV